MYGYDDPDTELLLALGMIPTPQMPGQGPMAPPPSPWGRGPENYDQAYQPGDAGVPGPEMIKTPGQPFPSDAIASTQTYGDEMAHLQGVQKFGQGLADTPMPQGRSTGRVFVAAHPLETMGASIKQGLGNAMTMGSLGAQGARIGQQRGDLSTVLGYSNGQIPFMFGG